MMDIAMVVLLISIVLPMWFCLANIDALLKNADEWEDDEE